MEDILKTEKTFTVLELNTQVRNLIKREFPANIWVCGEVQGLRPDRNKRHTYFELVEKHPQLSEIVAKVKVALFAGRKPLIMQRIAQAQGAFELKNDIEVRFLCEVSLHPPTGQYSLIIIDIDPVYTLGKVAQNRLKIIEELKKDGLLEKNKLNPMPLAPLNLGLITALDSAAYHDFINELQTSGYGFKVLAVNSYMQGRGVEKDVVAAFKYLQAQDLEMIVITRGGGSKADLAWFDNKKIAESIACARIPVLSALGHQIDISIADLVAHSSFKTPTKVAQFLVERVREVINNIETAGQKIMEGSLAYLESEAQGLKLKTLAIDSNTLAYLRDHRENLIGIKSDLTSQATQTLKEQSTLIDQKIRMIQDYLKRALQDARFNVKYIQDKLKLLDPKTILKRGYSITLKDRKAVKSTYQLKVGDIVKTVYSQGESTSTIKGLDKDD
jgi:exodeoxyribonuclease VII large subunit